MTDRFADDLDLAGQVQRLLFPKSSPVCDWNCIGVKNRMATGLGGDYFDIITMPDNCQIVFIGDVTGHGLHASVVMSLLYGFIYRSAMQVCSALDVVQQANRFLQTFAARSENLDYLFSSTLFFGVIAPDTLEMQYVNAGHPAPLVLRGDSQMALEPTAPPIGFLDDPEINMGTFRFAQNDRLLLFTDGITELANPAGELFGLERLQQLLSRERVDHLTFLDRLFAALNQFSGSDILRDDCTTIVIDLHGGRRTKGSL
ncbi:MAG: serine/threonine protein phosphatase [Desulfuromonadales bacterium GWD2_61_12]|nr:MAG: serine/threonine protein phosphatase [Desulfuromonadales bacterium GWC2_61_20]OGR33211.1 MAG: serine/threonine protein phosphatase [Desulfuromonadales bacterium GWD2_61_12]HBT83199.1 serine/threonine-protein phosphatase [Desulfuromonas sp.]